MSHQSNDVETLESVFSATDVLYAYMDTGFNFIRVNRAYAEADGREPEFYVGKNHFDLFPYRDNEKIFRRVIETGEAYTAKAKAFEYAGHPERGVSYWDWTLHPVKNSSGKAEAVVLCLIDATERIESERKLRESELRLSTAVESLPFDFFVLDLDSRCIFQNAASLEKWGDVTGKQPKDVAADPDILSIWKSNNRRAFAGEVVEEDIEFPMKVETRHYRNIISPIRDGGKIIGVQGINIDITERKQAEKLIRIQRDLAVELNAVRVLKEGLRICMGAAMEASLLDCGGIYLSDEETGAMYLACHRGLSDEFVKHASCFGPESPNTRFILEGKPVYSQHLKLGIPVDEPLRKEGLGAIAVIPFSHGGRVIGCLNMASHTVDEVPGAARNVLEAIAAQMGGAVSRLSAEGAQRKSENIYRTLVETSPDGIVLVGLNGEIVKVNRPAAWIAGYEDPEELIGRNAEEFIPKSEVDRFWERMGTGQDPNDTRPVSYALKRGDGTEIVIEGRSAVISDADGNPQSVMAIVRDVTDRIRADEALRESEEIYRALVETSPDAIVMTDLEANILRANRQAALLVGYEDPEGLVGNKSFEYIAPEDRERAIDNLMATVENGSTRGMEYTLSRRDGSTYPAELSASVIRNEIGEPRYLMAVMRDVSERKKAEQALRESEASLKAVSNAVGMVLHIMILDRELHVLEQNGKMLEVFGRCGGRRCHQAVKGKERACDECPAEKAWKDGGVHQLDENWIRPTTGAPECFRVFAVPMFEPDGSFEKVMVVAEDITGLKTSEEGRRKAEEELEEQRVVAIASDRLRSLGEMATGIAHELNQPLVGVRGLAEHVVLALEREWELSKDDVRAKLQKIVEQADRMAYIIEHVRMFAREADRPEMYPVNVNAVVDSSLGLVSAQLRQRGLELKCELSEDVSDVEANQYALEEVILNLVTNARDAVEERLESDSGADPVVTLRTLVENRDDGTWVKVEVTDRGVGISAEQLERVFDPFYTTKSPEKGTGLGLSISKSIIEKSGGTIEIRSEPGGGTTAIISLPAIRDE